MAITCVYSRYFFFINSPLNTLMTDLPTVPYTSTCEIPTLLYNRRLKKVPLSGRSLPVQAIMRNTPRGSYQPSELIGVACGSVFQNSGKTWKALHKVSLKGKNLLSRFFLERTGERLCGERRHTSARLPSVKTNKQLLVSNNHNRKIVGVMHNLI